MTLNTTPQFDYPKDPKWDWPWYKRLWQAFLDWFPLPPKNWWGE